MSHVNKINIPCVKKKLVSASTGSLKPYNIYD